MRKLLVGLAMMWASTAHAGTAFYSGEEQGILSKVCYYNYLGSTYTLNTSAVALCPLQIRVPDVPPISTIPPIESPGLGTAFLSGERTTGMTKVCFYDYLGDTYTKTVSAVSLCPLSVRVRR